ncbi:MAG: protein kinase [Polyangiaceae bacterium]
MTPSRKLKRSEQLEPSSKYELIARLAAGGMGAVYVGRARRESGGAPLVAVKRAHAHLLEDPVFRKMFVAEARLAARIRHPNVVGVSDIDESDGELLIVMDYVEGASLSDLLASAQRASRRLPPAVAIRIALDAIEGLHAAHSARDDAGRLLGIVHRDVSPHNVLVGADGVARIVDFGVAKAIDHEGTNTQSGVLKGKAAYMAPEYLKGKIASPRSDVFSMGIVAWEGITCKRLFRSEDEVETMQRILDDAPAPLVSDVAFVDPSIDAVIARALEKDPARRYASAADFARELEAAARTLDCIAAPAEVGVVMEAYLGEDLAARRALVNEALDALGDRTIARRRAPESAPQKTVALGPFPAGTWDPTRSAPPSALPQVAPRPPLFGVAPAPSFGAAPPPIPGPVAHAPMGHAAPRSPVFAATPVRLARRPSLGPGGVRSASPAPLVTTQHVPAEHALPGQASPRVSSSRVLPLAILGAMIATAFAVFGILKLRDRPSSATAAGTSAEPDRAEPAASERAVAEAPIASAASATTEPGSPLVLDATAASASASASSPQAPGSASPDVATLNPSAPRSVTTGPKPIDPRRTTFTPRQNPY